MTSGAGSAKQSPIGHHASASRGGLIGFDLGRIPAPVTPPPSSRHAGWFATAASMLAGVALAMITSNLVGPPLEFRTVEALPGLPGMRLDSTVPLPGVVGANAPRPSSEADDVHGRPAKPASTSATSTPAAPVLPAADGGTPGGHWAGHHGPVSAKPTTASTTLTPSAEAEAPIQQGSPAEAVPSLTGMPASDPQTMADRAEMVSHLVCADLATRYEMTMSALRDPAVDAGDASLINSDNSC